jgi:hypothetical protein
MMLLRGEHRLLGLFLGPGVAFALDASLPERAFGLWQIVKQRARERFIIFNRGLDVTLPAWMTSIQLVPTLGVIGVYFKGRRGF